MADFDHFFLLTGGKWGAEPPTGGIFPPCPLDAATAHQVQNGRRGCCPLHPSLNEHQVNTVPYTHSNNQSKIDYYAEASKLFPNKDKSAFNHA